MNTEIIDEILDEFDFETVHRTMKALDWKWSGCEVDIPSIGDLRRQARLLLQELFRNKYRCTGTGGLFAYNENGIVGLRFEVTSYEVDVE
jgi:hypothetical protein